jgi:hypothetical protein
MLTAEADGSPAEVRAYRPWLQRRIDASARSPLKAGLGIAAALLAGFFAIGLASWVGAALVDVAIEAALR